MYVVRKQFSKYQKTNSTTFILQTLYHISLVWSIAKMLKMALFIALLDLILSHKWVIWGCRISHSQNRLNQYKTQKNKGNVLAEAEVWGQKSKTVWFLYFTQVIYHSCTKYMQYASYIHLIPE